MRATELAWAIVSRLQIYVCFDDIHELEMPIIIMRV